MKEKSNDLRGKSLSLHIPKLEDLYFREKMLTDPKTMSYNKGYELAYRGYDNETGCVDFPKEDWQAWYKFWINNEPDRFYAYILREEDGAFIGEVNLHKSKVEDWHEMGILIYSKYRGEGYSNEALNLLVEYAFQELGIESIHNNFEASRHIALEVHKKVGFIICDMEGELVDLILRKDHWEEIRKKTRTYY